MMRTSLSILFILQTLLLFSQIVDITILSIDNDTIHAKATVKTQDGELAEERFYRTLKSQEKISRKEFTTSGQRPYYELDSIFVHSYSVDWSLNHTDTIYDSAYQYEYTKNEITLERNSYFLEGRVQSKLSVAIGLRNGTPQDYKVYLKSDKAPLSFSKESVLLPNRSIIKLPIEVSFMRGRNEHFLEVENSNGSEKFVSIETVGYDLIDSDFKEPSKKISTRKVRLEDSPDLYLEVKGNYKLLTIINKNGEQKMPVSQLINPINRSYFTRGKNVLQLQNLKTGAIKSCKVKVR